MRRRKPHSFPMFLLPIPVNGSVASGTQWLNCSVHVPWSRALNNPAIACYGTISKLHLNLLNGGLHLTHALVVISLRCGNSSLLAFVHRSGVVYSHPVLSNVVALPHSQLQAINHSQARVSLKLVHEAAARGGANANLKSRLVLLRIPVL